MSILLDLAKNLAIQRGIGSLQKRIDSYFGGDDDRTDNFTSQHKSGGLGAILCRALAFAFLGPIAGPLSFSAGRGLLSKQQGLGFSPFGEDKGPSGIVSGKVQTLDGKIVDAGSEEAKADMNRRDREFQETGDYDVYSGTTVTTGPDYGPVTSGTVFDAEDDGGGDDSGGSTGSMDASDFSDDTAGTPFRYGGLASLYR